MEDFVDVISLRMKNFQDNYEVTDNLGESYYALLFLKHVMPRFYLTVNILYMYREFIKIPSCQRSSFVLFLLHYFLELEMSWTLFQKFLNVK